MAKGLEANYGKARPEAVAKALLKHRPGSDGDDRVYPRGVFAGDVDPQLRARAERGKFRQALRQPDPEGDALVDDVMDWLREHPLT